MIERKYRFINNSHSMPERKTRFECIRPMTHASFGKVTDPVLPKQDIEAASTEDAQPPAGDRAQEMVE